MGERKQEQVERKKNEKKKKERKKEKTTKGAERAQLEYFKRI